MKKFLVFTAFVIVILLLMILPGFVLYIVGDIGNKLFPDSKEPNP